MSEALLGQLLFSSSKNFLYVGEPGATQGQDLRGALCSLMSEPEMARSSFCFLAFADEKSISATGAQESENYFNNKQLTNKSSFVAYDIVTEKIIRARFTKASWQKA